MHELLIQICFVTAGLVTGCTDGYITTNDPYMTSQDLSPVYVHNAPQCVERHYESYYRPNITVYPRRATKTRVIHRHHHHNNRNVRVIHRHHHHNNRNVKVIHRHRHKPKTKVVSRYNKPKVVIKPAPQYKKKKNKKNNKKKNKNKNRRHY